MKTGLLGNTAAPFSTEMGSYTWLLSSETFDDVSASKFEGAVRICERRRDKPMRNTLNELPVSVQMNRLNEKQRSILWLVCKGLRNAEAAEQLGLSERTVKGYISQLFLIFDVTNRTELVGRIARDSLGTSDPFGSGHNEGPRATVGQT
jgi:DNA-binding CsgD family transcriptional regulator